jgi:hypothetical protein
LAELGADELRAATVLHPNIWSGHGAWQMRSWLARAREAGLMVMPPEGSWPALLVAADCVITDHGSVGLYAAAADRPVLVAPFGNETVPGTAIAMLGDASVRLDVRGSLRDQVLAAMEKHQPGTYGEVIAKAFAGPPAARSVRSVVYELMALPEPPYELPLAGHPSPDPETVAPRSYAVYTRQFDGGVEVRRIPASVDAAASAPVGWWRHLAVDEREWDLRLLHSAAVLVSPESGDEKHAREALARLPGAELAVAPTADGAMVTVRGGGRIEVRDVGRRWDPMVLGAAVWMVSRFDLPIPQGLAIRTGDAVSSVHLSPRQ